MALLQMINQVRGKLREERIGSIATSDLLTTEIIDLINDAGSEILEAHEWDFDVRHDGKLFNPGKQSGSSAQVIYQVPDDDEQPSSSSSSSPAPS